jgi:hypothetical protein
MAGYRNPMDLRLPVQSWEGRIAHGAARRMRLPPLRGLDEEKKPTGEFVPNAHLIITISHQPGAIGGVDRSRFP